MLADEVVFKGVPEFIRSDSGPKMTTKEVRRRLQEVSVRSGHPGRRRGLRGTVGPGQASRLENPPREKEGHRQRCCHAACQGQDEGAFANSMMESCAQERQAVAIVCHGVS